MSTSTSTTPKVIYQLTGCESGDGSAQHPVATMDEALDLWRQGDYIAREGVLPPLPQADGNPLVGYGWLMAMFVGAVILSAAFLAGLVVLAVHHPYGVLYAVALAGGAALGIFLPPRKRARR